MAKDNAVELKGKVTQALPNAQFRVLLETGHEALASVSGKIRIKRIRIVPGDTVTVEVSLYDPTKGRITRRGSNQNPAPTHNSKAH
mgnify:CR=1 FL=1